MYTQYIIRNVQSLIDVAFKRTFSQATTSRRKPASWKKNGFTQALELNHYLLYTEIHNIMSTFCITNILFSVYIVTY